MSLLYDLARCTVASAPGTGPISLGPAVYGFLTFALAGLQDGQVTTYAINDGVQSEIGHGTYTAATNTLTRDLVFASTNGGLGGSKISVSAFAQVFITPSAEDLATTNSVQYLAPLSTSVSRSLTSKLADVISVKDFGAVADGVTDDAPAINAAIVAANAYSTNGATVYFPGGAANYKILSPIVLRKRVNLLGDGGMASTIEAVNCDAVLYTGGATVYDAYGQLTISGLHFKGSSPTASRAGLNFTSDDTTDHVLCGLLIQDCLIEYFDVAIKFKTVQDAVIRNVWAQYVNNGCLFVGIVYNTLIVDSNFFLIPTLVPPTYGATYGLSLTVYSYTAPVALILPPEGITVTNSNFYNFDYGANVDACDSFNMHNSYVVALVTGFRFKNVTTVNNFTNNSIEMHGTNAVSGIYGVPLPGVTNSHKTNLINNTIQGVVSGAIATPNCSGIVINGAGGQYQDDVIIQNNFCKNLALYDLDIRNPGGITRLINNKLLSNGTNSILAGIPATDSILLIQGNTCFKSIDYANVANLVTGAVRTENNTINNGAYDKSSWNITSGAAQYITITGPTAARTYTLPDATDTITTIAAVQILTNKVLTLPTITAGTPANPGVLGYGSNQLNFGDGTVNRVVVTIDQTQTLTNKTLTSPTLTTPALGVATATSVNGVVINNNAWTAYTATLAAAVPGTSVLTLNSSRYKQIGKTIFLQGDFTITTAGTGSGIISMTLPTTAAAFRFAGAGLEAAVSNRGVSASIAVSGTTVLLCDCGGAPLAFANGARTVFGITYEVP